MGRCRAEDGDVIKEQNKTYHKGNEAASRTKAAGTTEAKAAAL